MQRSNRNRVAYSIFVYTASNEEARARGIFAWNQRSMCLRENRERQMKLDAVKRIKWQWGYHGIG